MKIILASTSEYRAEQIRKLNIDPIIIAPRVDEKSLNNPSFGYTALIRARAKAQEVLIRHHSENKGSNARHPFIVIGCDQVAEFNGQSMSKPGDTNNAISQLTQMSGKEVLFHTALCIMKHRPEETPKVFESVDLTKVKFRELSSDEINAYVEQESPLNCAGSFKSEALGIALFDRIQTDDPSALIGIPLIALNKGLIALGYNSILAV